MPKEPSAAYDPFNARNPAVTPMHDGPEAELRRQRQRGVSAVIQGGVSRLELAARGKPSWPSPGQPCNGIKPGTWRETGHVDETGFLPLDCPIRPLGYEGENFYFEDTKGQIFNTGDKAMGVERIQKLFSGHEDFLYWAWPARDDKKMMVDPGFKSERVRRDLFAACDAKGPWSMTDMVRGRGAWKGENGALILHCGEYLWTDGRLERTGEAGKHFYVRRPAALMPWNEPVPPEDNPAAAIFAALQTWNMARGDTDCLLLLGWIGVALMGAALDWRPSVFITGSQGTGKSALTGRDGLLRKVLGRAMLSTTNASEAGLYQIVGHDSLPIALDELENEGDNDQATQKLLKMARDAASGSIRIRGGQDHKGVEFQAQSTFLFSAIRPPDIPPASLTRMAIIELRELETDDGREPELVDAETIGPRLLRRVADQWHDWPALYERYRAAMRQHGHTSRGQNTFGTLLAAGHLLLGDAGMQLLGIDPANLDRWASELSAESVIELENAQPSWLECIERIMNGRLNAWQKGEQHTVAQILAMLEKPPDGDAELGEKRARSQLAQADLGLVSVHEIRRRIYDAQQAGKPAPAELLAMIEKGWCLAVPNRGEGVSELFRRSNFGGQGLSGSWHYALRAAPTGITSGDKAINRVTIGGQRQVRCTLVFLDNYNAWVDAHG